MQMTAGNGPVPSFGRARFSFRCWPSGLAYSTSRSNATPSGTVTFGGCWASRAGAARRAASPHRQWRMSESWGSGRAARSVVHGALEVKVILVGPGRGRGAGDQLPARLAELGEQLEPLAGLVGRGRDRVRCGDGQLDHVRPPDRLAVFPSAHRGVSGSGNEAA